MARKQPVQSTETVSPETVITPKAEATAAEETSVTTTEAAPEVVEVPTEAPAEVPTETTAPAAPVETEPEPDLSGFEAAAEAAIAGSDGDGNLTDEQQEAVATTYRDLSTKGKARARTWINDRMKAAMTGGEFQAARASHNLHESLLKTKAPATPREPKAPADPTQAFVDQLVTLRLAYRAVTLQQPEGVDADFQDKIKPQYDVLEPSLAGYITWVVSGAEEGEPEVSDVVKRAVRIATSKGGRKASTPRTGAVYSGPQRSISKHIAEAFAGEKAGTFLKISQITSFKSAEYGADTPSQGAVAAALKSAKFSVPGVTPAEQDGKKGARKGA